MVNSGYILVAISFVLISAFWFGLLYFIYSNQIVERTFLSCPVNQCATNIYNGEKRCGNEGVSVFYDPTFETCNSKYTCESPLTPYALLTTGETDDMGVCDPNVICRCLSKPRVPSEILTFFTYQGGSAADVDLNEVNRGVFYQTSISSGADYGGFVVEYEPSLNRRYLIDSTLLERVIPKNPKCEFSGVSPTLTQIYECMEVGNPNPCSIGRLAYYPNLGTQFAFRDPDIYTGRLGCFPNNRVGGQACTDIFETYGVKAVSYWDRGSNTIRCVDENGTTYD